MLFLNEVIGSLLKRNVYGVTLKLGMKKAPDHVNSSFLLLILNEMRSNEKWIGWISMKRFSILVMNL